MPEKSDDEYVRALQRLQSINRFFEMWIKTTVAVSVIYVFCLLTYAALW